MKKIIIAWCIARLNNWLTPSAKSDLGFRYISEMLANSDKFTRLTPQILIDAGWREGSGSKSGNRYFQFPEVKSRDKIVVEFENHYYRVWLGPDGTFVSLESSAEWLEIFLLLQDKTRTFKNSRELLKLF